MKYKVTIANNAYEVEIEDIASRPVIALVEGERFEVWPDASGDIQPGLEAAPQPSAPMEMGDTASSPQQLQPINTSPLPREVNYEIDMASSSSLGRSRSSTVLAPIPGTIVAITVKPGQEVELGQELCVLDAMKMESPIRASRPGKIGTIHISVGDNVKHHQLLMEYAD